jgi:hypothetical protein
MFFWEKGLEELGFFSGYRTAKDLLEVVVVGQFFSSHDPPRAGEQRHSGLPANGPLDHLAIGLTRMIDESRDGSPSGVDNHLVVETHKVIALAAISQRNCATRITTHLVSLVYLLHAPLALRLRDNLPSVFHDDLIRAKSSHGPHTVASIFGV